MARPFRNSRKNRSDQPPEFLTMEQVLIIHTDQIDRYGGSQGLRDLALLESALFRPQTTFAGRDLYPVLFDKAAALMHSLILNHPFVDGNKRTGVVSAFIFLELNGRKVKASNKEVISLALKVESKKLRINEISRWLLSHSLDR